MNNQCIVDTSAIYALVDRTDPNHWRAASFLKQSTKPGTLLLSNHVFDEIMTLTKARLGAHVAVQLGVRLRNSQVLQIIIFSTAEEMHTWRIFGQYHDKAWSYTDCACLALAQQRDVQKAFSFDHHFTQMGLQVVP